jgi:hypothetical protein
LDLQKKSDFLLFSMSREALKSYPLKSNPNDAINLTIMKPLATPRQMKDAVREAAERGRSNF